MSAVFTTVGLDAIAAADRNSLPFIIDNIKIGSSPARYDATISATDIKDPNPIVVSGGAIEFIGNRATVQVNVSIETSAAATGVEVGFFAGSTLIVLWANAGSDVFVKSADTNAFISLVYEYTGVAPTGLTITLQVFPIATLLQAQANNSSASNSVLMTVRRTWDWWNTAITEAIIRTKIRMASTGEAQSGSGTGILDTNAGRALVDRHAPQIPKASASEARAGTNDSKYMTPDKTVDFYDARITISNSDPTNSDADTGKKQIWFVR